MFQNWSNQDFLNPNISNIEDLEKPIIINLSKIAEKYVKQINENVDNIVLKNLSTEYLENLKKKINEELKNRRKVNQ